MDVDRIREKVLERYQPGEEELEELRQKYNRIARFIQKEFDRDTHFAGSASRGTCVKGDRDIDIFVLFPETVDSQQLEDEGLEIGKSVFNEFGSEFRIEYAEHPYTKGEIEGQEVEIVPCYDIDPEEIKSSVDRTPHHSRWVKENLDPEERQDVILLKQFLKAADLYGSSLKTRGFSGYLCEVLIKSYGGFQELVREAFSWPEQKVLDPEQHHGEDLPENLKEKFSEDNLVVIDPVDPERNVAAVLSTENYSRFIYTCWSFRREQGINFFESQETEVTEFDLKQELNSRGDFFVLEFETPEEVQDIVYPQMRKAVTRIENELEDHEFRLFSSGFYVGDRTSIFFELHQELPEIREREGPKVFHGEDHLAQFTGKYENTYVKEERLCAKTTRDYTDAKHLLGDFLEDSLEEKGIPGKVAEKMGDYRFKNPLDGSDEWLKYLAEQLHVTGDKNG